MGCGRMFEGTYEQMFASLQRLSALSDDTVLFCAHEYTLANAKFALSVEPTNAALRARVKQVEDLRAQGLATVPTDLRIERETNPFLRHHSAEIREVLKLPKDVSDVDVFAAIRKAKDKF
jgi:hydroxyacylglutathione hydrolase